MDKRELLLLRELAPKYPDLQALWDEHILFEKQLEKLEGKIYRSPQEEQQVRELKKQKLDGKTKLVALIDRYAASKEG
jgi:uncharacterized protein YdcH (DUF465 family)